MLAYLLGSIEYARDHGKTWWAVPMPFPLVQLETPDPAARAKSSEIAKY